MVAFLLLWSGVRFTSALKRPGWGRVLGLTGIIFAIAVAPLYLERAVHRQWRGDFINSLSRDLYTLGGQQLSGRVQCLYTPADCATVLYRMKLVQATGLSYDFFIFGSDYQPIVRHYRTQFWREIQQNPPEVFIVGKGLFPNDLNDYQKLEQWPQLHDYLKDYVLYDAREFDPADSGPRGFRIYLRRGIQLSAAFRPLLILR
jgi:hypothetical protein